jgi:hypothetical protein
LSASGVGVFTTSALRASTNFHEAGAQPAFPPSIVVAIKALAWELPSRRGLPLARHLGLRQSDVQRVDRHRVPGIGTEQNGLGAQNALHPPARTRVFDQISGIKIQRNSISHGREGLYAAH